MIHEHQLRHPAYLGGVAVPQDRGAESKCVTDVGVKLQSEQETQGCKASACAGGSWLLVTDSLRPQIPDKAVHEKQKIKVDLMLEICCPFHLDAYKQRHECLWSHLLMVSWFHVHDELVQSVSNLNLPPPW